MTVNKTLDLASDDHPKSPLPSSELWWERRTSEELRDIINRGFAGGQAFAGATAEVERRTRAAEREREAAVAEEERQAKTVRLIVLAAIAGVTIAASAGIWLVY